jgi:DNA replication and repair protein RecF
MISSLRLQNFRSYADNSFEFDPGVNIVVGPNASGKTNLLEAVLVLARGNSYRVRDAELIRQNKPWARLEGYFESQHRVIKIDESGKTLVIDDKPYRRISLDKTVPAVIFEPNHLQLMTRGPETRRDYFDDLLSRSQPGYKTLIGNYKRTLAQRNALLKHNRQQALQQLFVWNIRLSEFGSQIATARAGIVSQINKSLARDYSQIAHKKCRVKVEYQLQFPAETYASRVLHKLESSVQKDFERGFTAYGPHREDFAFFLNGQDAALSASRGETRSLLLALKIFELSVIEKVSGQKPMLLLDDVFSELDGARRRALVERLSGHQTIITTTDAEAVLEYFSNAHNLIPLG